MQRQALSALLCLALAGQFGCDEGRPTKVLRLEITRAGQYVLEGRAVDEAELRDALSLAKRSGTPVELEISASPEANYQPVGKAVTLAQSQQIALIRFASSPAPVASGASAPKQVGP